MIFSRHVSRPVIWKPLFHARHGPRVPIRRIINSKAGPAAAPASTPTVTVGPRPPFGVRALLVGSSVGLGTPLFATIGVVAAWHRVLPKHPATQAAVILIAGGGIGTIIHRFVGPFLSEHSEVVLPFAAANGVSAAFWYSVLEAQVGLAAMAGSLEALTGGGHAAERMHWLLKSRPAALLFKWGLPFGGPAVGVLTAASAGYMYPLFARLLWPSDLQSVMGFAGNDSDEPSFSWMVDLHHWLLVPVTLPVGLISGYGLHQALAPALLGTLKGGTLPWTHVVLPLLGSVTAMSAYYFSSHRGTYDTRALFWEARLDYRTGVPYSYNLRTGARVEDGLERVAAADAAAGGVRLLGTLRGGLPALWRNFIGLSSWEEESERNANNGKGNGNGSAGSSSPSFMLPLKARDVTWFQLKAHSELHLLIDQLVRLKHLELQNMPKEEKDSQSSSSTLANDAVVDAVAETAKVIGAGAASGVQLTELLRWAEVALLAEHEAEASQSRGDDLNTKQHSKVRAQLQAKIDKKGSGQLATTPGGALKAQLLSAHLPLLRQRLKDDLGYAPSDDRASQETLSTLKGQQNAAEWLSWAYRVGIVPFGIGLVVARIALEK